MDATPTMEANGREEREAVRAEMAALVEALDSETASEDLARAAARVAEACEAIQPVPARDVPDLARAALALVESADGEEECAAWLADVQRAAVALQHAALLPAPAASPSEPEVGEEGEVLVAELCERLWSSKLPGREGLAARTLPWLLVRAITSADPGVCRRAQRFASETLDLFDWQDASAQSLKRLLLRACFCPPFLRTAEGRTMLARCLTLDAAFSHEVVAVMRNQLLAGRASVADHYGDVLFRAWRLLQPSDADGAAAVASAAAASCLLELEDTLLPSLVRDCLGARTPQLSDLLRRVLRHALFSQRKRKGVEDLIVRTLQAQVFRAGQCANAEARRHAACLLCEAFPLLESPPATAAGPRAREALNQRNATLLAKQTKLLASLLSDDVPQVRRAAAAGAGAVLAATRLPAVDAARLAGKVADLMHDAAQGAAPVREAALRAMAAMLASPLTCDVAREAARARGAGKALADPSPRVRQAAAALLVAMGRDAMAEAFAEAGEGGAAARVAACAALCGPGATPPAWVLEAATEGAPDAWAAALRRDVGLLAAAGTAQ